MAELICAEFYVFPASFAREAEKSLFSIRDLIVKKYRLVSHSQAKVDVQIRSENILAYDLDYQCEVTDKILVKIVACNGTAEAIKKDQKINPERWYGS